jgi:hypothetical protein
MGQPMTSFDSPIARSGLDGPRLLEDTRDNRSQSQGGLRLREFILPVVMSLVTIYCLVQIALLINRAQPEPRPVRPVPTIAAFAS